MQCTTLIPVTIKEEYGRELVPCGKCEVCLQNNRKDWFFRLSQEYKVAESAHFLTFTYDEENHPEDGNVSKKDMQIFKKQLRNYNLKYFLKKNPLIKTNKDANALIKKLRYYTVAEYGTKTLRPHYHSIMFNLQPETEQILEKLWKKGFVHRGDVNEATINYVCKYLINKKDDYGQLTKPFNLISKGLGANYNTRGTDTYHRENDSLVVRNTDGTKQRLPRYYKDRMFEKEHLHRISGVLTETIRHRSILEKERIRSLGQDPYVYQLEQRKLAISKIIKSKSENDKI